MKRYFPRTFVKDGYKLIDIKVSKAGDIVALIDRNISFCSFVVAWNYNLNDGTWGQGHYFETMASAKRYFDTY